MLSPLFFRLSPSIFAILENSAIAKKSSSRLDRLSIFYVFGTFLVSILVFLITFIVMSFSTACRTFMPEPFFWILSCVLGLEAIILLLSHFKITKKLTQSFAKKAENTKTKKDAFILGLITRIIELPFVLPLIVLTTYESIILSSIPNFAIMLIYLTISILPCILIYTYFHTRHKLADFEKLSTKTHLFASVILSILYIATAILLLYHDVAI